jgi:hypothetical protein
VLLFHFITLAYSLSTRTQYHFFAKSSDNNSHAVLIPDPAGPEKAIFRCIIYIIIHKKYTFDDAYYNK